MNILRERTIMRLANNLLFYWHELFACRAALCRPRHPPPGLYLVANGSRGYGLVGLLLWA